MGMTGWCVPCNTVSTRAGLLHTGQQTYAVLHSADRSRRARNPSGFHSGDPIAADTNATMTREHRFLFSYLMRTCLRAGMALCLAVAAGESMATPAVELQLGRSYMDSAGAATVFAEGIFSERSMGSTRFSWAPDFSAGWIDGRDLQRYRRASCTTTDAIWLVAAGARIRYGTNIDWYHSLFFSFQPALHTGRTQALSSAYEFVSSVGWQGDRVSFQLRHVSNGSFHEPNRGETMALLGMRFDL
jgi:hypothetical protein